MFLARVVGRVVATQKIAGLEGQKLLLVEPRDSEGRVIGERLVACDQAQAGPGDLVYCVSSREATLAMPDSFVAVDAAIVGFVDDVQREGRS